MKHRNRIFVCICLVLLLVIGYQLWSQQRNPDSRSANPMSTSNIPEPAIEPMAPGSSQTVDTAQTAFHLYFPYDTGTEFAIKEVTALVSLEENETPLERVSELLQEATNEGGEQLVPVLGPEAKILGVEIVDEDIVKVNLNSEFVSQMNAGAALEGQILKSLVKTLADLYETKGVLLRVNGQNYESGHYYFTEDDVIYADNPGL